MMKRARMLEACWQYLPEAEFKAPESSKEVAEEEAQTATATAASTGCLYHCRETVRSLGSRPL